MKLLKYFLFIISQINIWSASAQTFEWANSAGGNLGDIGNGIAMDNSKNLYVTGSFMDSAYFNNSLLIANPLPYNSDIFLAKYSSSGQLIWTKQAGGIGTQESYGIDVQNNSIYVAGVFCGGSSNFDTFHINSSAGCAAFLAKYDTSGNCIWVRQGIGNNYSSMQSVCAFEDGSINVIGNFEDSILLTGISNSILLNTVDQSPGIFLAKYDNNGELIWAKKAGGLCNYPCGNNGQPRNTLLAKSISKDKSGNCFITGNFTGTVSFNSSIISCASTGGIENWNVFLAKYDSNGNLMLLQQYGGLNYDDPNGLKVDSSGNIYLIGRFDNTTTFQTTTLNCNIFDMFLCKLDDSGNVLWVKQGAISIGGEGYALDFTNNEDLILSGRFKGNLNFGEGSVSLNSNKGDAFIAKITKNGNIVWALKTNQQTSGGKAGGKSIVTDMQGNAFATGYFEGQTEFGHTTYTGKFNDIFIAKISGPYVGIKKLSPALTSVNVFPNPTSGIILIDSRNQNVLNIKVFNSLGEVVYELNGNVSFMALSQFDPGTYFIRITTDTAIEVKKIILERLK
jgi:hypothetical protein